jgi:epoxyqueuosine reductase
MHTKPDNLTGLLQEVQQGRISRRDFLHAAALLGVSVGASGLLAGCDQLAKGFATSTPENTPPYIYMPGEIVTPVGGEIFPPTDDPGSTPAPTGVSTPQPEPTTGWLCACCNEQFRTNDELLRHAAIQHQWRLPATQRVDQPTYSAYLVGKVERFDEKNTVFSRTTWDKSYQARVGVASAKAKPGDWEYFEGNAVVAGAIFVDNTAGALHPNYGGYFGHINADAGLYGWDSPVNTTRFPVEDPTKMAQRVKQVARLYGANLVGVTQVNPSWIYSNSFSVTTGEYAPLAIPYKYAIVMGIEMDWDWIKHSPETGASAATALAYSRMSELASSLAEYIRNLGYSAIPCGNDTAQSIPLAIDAGLGEIGRNGLLMSPEYGPRQRICKVFTDLPLVPDKPIDFGMTRYCEKCHACATSCPVNAIPNGDRSTEPTSISNRTGILRWTVNVEKCFLFWRENRGIDCSNCIASCPWAIRNPRVWIEKETW